ncbi:MAG: D-alanyl-D-alanine carboxypeptidase family protein [Pseudomonadota bacterium]
MFFKPTGLTGSGRRTAIGMRDAVARPLLFAGVALVAALAATPAQAAFQTKAKQAILIDADSGAILYQRNADQLMSPASMSKLMTLAVMFRALKTGQLTLDEEFLMTENAWRKGGAPSGTSAMFVPLNKKAKISQLLQGIIVQSGNDASIAVAEGMAGSEAQFAKIMEAEARRIGLKKSTFRNATGLYHPEHLMTARELAILSRHIIKTYPDFYKMFAQKEFRYRRHRFINRNPLLFVEPNVDGLKTGFVSKAGYGLVASAKGKGRRLILVVNGLATKQQRKEEGRKLLQWGFRSFKEFKLFDAGDVIGQARVWGGTQVYVPLTGNGVISVILPRFPANQRLRGEIVYNRPLKPPIRKGDEVAKLRVTTSANAVNEVPLYAAEDVKRAGMMRRGLDSLLHLALGWIPL